MRRQSTFPLSVRNRAERNIPQFGITLINPMPSWEGRHHRSPVSSPLSQHSISLFTSSYLVSSNITSLPSRFDASMAPPTHLETSSSASRRPTVTASRPPRLSSLPTGPEAQTTQVEPGLSPSEPLPASRLVGLRNTYNINTYQRQEPQNAVLSWDGSFNVLGHNPYSSSSDGNALASDPSTHLGQLPPPAYPSRHEPPAPQINDDMNGSPSVLLPKGFRPMPTPMGSYQPPPPYKLAPPYAYPPASTGPPPSSVYTIQTVSSHTSLQG
jgi:hypothetical protein